MSLQEMQTASDAVQYAGTRNDVIFRNACSQKKIISLFLFLLPCQALTAMRARQMNDHSTDSSSIWKFSSFPAIS